MSSTETFAAPAAVTALRPRWWGGGDDEGDVAPAEEWENGPDGHDGHVGHDRHDGHSGLDGLSRTDWGASALRSALRDPYGQQFRPHLFGI